MASQINVQPQVLDLYLYSGDGFKMNLTCKTPDGDPVDLTGAVKAEIRDDRLHPTDPPLVSFVVDLVDAYLGIAKLSLTAADTLALTDHVAGNTYTGVWDVAWDPADDEPRTLVQGKVECVVDVTR